MRSFVARGWWIALFAAMMFAQPTWAAPPAPGYKVTATNLSLSGQGSGTTSFTLTSVQGYGENGVIVKCAGPNPNLLPYVVIPACSVPQPIVNLPAGGSVGGTISFFPPWTATQAASRRSWPLTGLLASAIGLFGFGMRKRVRRPSILMAATLSFFLLTGMTACIGGSGLAMTPGIYTFVISGTGKVSASTSIAVTVKCNSCP